MTTIKTILFAGVVALGFGACHHDTAANTTPANNTYSTAPDQNAGTPTPVENSYNTGTTGTTGTTTTNPDVNGTGTQGTANPGMNGTTPTQNQTTTPPAGAINSTDNSSFNNSNNQQQNGQRTNGNYNNSKNSVPSATNGTNVNTDSDMDRTGNSGTTKEGNPGTATTPDR